MLAQLQQLGYEYKKELEVTMPYRWFFCKYDAQAERACQIHLVEHTHEFWQRHLCFKDRLRNDLRLAQHYEQLKLKLAQQYEDSREYATAENQFIDQVLLDSGLSSVR